MNRKGFSIYLTFLVTTIAFMLVTGSQDISVLTLNIGRSDAIDVITYHGADGGLERGLGRLRKSFAPFEMTYESALKPVRKLTVNVKAIQQGKLINLTSEAVLKEGNKEVSRRILSRSNVANVKGREESGRFTEAI